MALIITDSTDMGRFLNELINELMRVGQGANMQAHVLDINELPPKDLLDDPDGWCAGLIIKRIVQYADQHGISDSLPAWVRQN